MKIVADTDMLSIFAKIRRLDILKKLFDEVLIPQAVSSELRKGEIDISGLNYCVVTLSREELHVLRKLDARLDKGERECFVIAKSRSLPLSSNETIVQTMCKKENIGYFSLPRLLNFAILKEVISREEAKQLVKLIEEEENTIIKNKEEIFK